MSCLHIRLHVLFTNPRSLNFTVFFRKPDCLHFRKRTPVNRICKRSLKNFYFSSKGITAMWSIYRQLKENRQILS